MLRRKELEKYLEERAYVLSDDTKLSQAIATHANQKYNIPKSIVTDCICGRKDISEFSDYTLFCIADSIAENNKANTNFKKAYYFTDIEIKTYENQKYVNEDELMFPLKFENMVQISDSQWIGKTSVKQLMQLKNNQLINYNKNTQRSLRKVVSKGVEHYKIFVNKVAVKQIMNSYTSGSYIPNPITLNLTETADFYYDEEAGTVVINSFDGFDILDGYHRYLALSSICMMNPDFDYDMELRLVCFSEDKCQQFIFQEDQKTKMRKVDSNSLNQNNPANIIAKRLNDDALFNLKGLINRDEGLINFGDFATLIDTFYLKGKRKASISRKMMVDISKELRIKFNVLTESDSKYLENHYSYGLLIAIMYVFSSDVEIDDMVTTIELLYEYINTTFSAKMLDSRPPRNKLIEGVHNFMEELVNV